MSPVFGVLFDGLAYGTLLFLLSVGLSVTLGMMNFVNLAHCSFAMLGGYVTVTLMNRLGWPFFATLPAAFVAAAAASVVLERAFFRRFYNASDLEQCLLTIGIVFVSIAAAAYIYGTDQQPVQLPAFLRGSIAFAGLNFAVYRLFLIGISLIITVLLIATLEMTRFGAQVRAAVNNQRMARGLGIDVDVLFAVTFALGSGLALRLDRRLGWRAGFDRRLACRRDAARRQRYRRQILCAGHRLDPDLFGHDGADHAAPCRDLREALAWLGSKLIICAAATLGISAAG
jgi:branched-chain amino acid transport system permease protein